MPQRNNVVFQLPGLHEIRSKLGLIGVEAMVVNVEKNTTRKYQHQSEVVAQILKMLGEIQFGSIEITIHDGKVAQIERKEKIRPNAI